VAQGFRCPQHGCERNHGVAVGPYCKNRREAGGLAWCAAPKNLDRTARALLLLVAAVTMLAGPADHLVEIAVLPSLPSAARDHHHAGLFHFGLAERRRTKFLLLLAVADDHKTPGLQIVAAGRFQSGADDLLEVSAVDGHVLKTRRGPALADGLAQQFFCGSFRHRSTSSTKSNSFTRRTVVASDERLLIRFAHPGLKFLGWARPPRQASEPLDADTR